MAKKKPTPKLLPPAKEQREQLLTADAVTLLTDLRVLIRDAREQVARAVNSALVLLYWQVGHRIYTEVLQENRAAYGEQVIPGLAVELSLEFGARVCREESPPHDPVRRNLPGSGNCRDAVATIELESFSGSVAADSLLEARFLCRDVPYRTVERACITGKDRGYAVRADGAVPQARGAGHAGIGQAARERHPDAGLSVPGPILPRFPRPKRHLQREGPGGGDPTGDGTVHPRTGGWVHLCRPAKTDGDRRR